MNRQIRLKARPVGEPTADNFEAVDAPMPDAQRRRRPAPDDLPVARSLHARPDERRAVVCDPGRDRRRHGRPHRERGRRVAQSRLQPGDFVVGYDGWQAYGVRTAKELRKLDPTRRPISTAIGVLGMPGMTAFVGLIDIGQPKAGRDGRRLRGLRRRRRRRRTAREDQGLPRRRHRRRDGQVPLCGRGARLRRVHQLQDRTTSCRRCKAACPNGVDVYFENVGGAVFAAILRVINRGRAHPAVRHDLQNTTPPRIRRARTCGRCSSNAR